MVPLDALSSRWPEISALLDEALALPVAERAGWLESLIGEQAAFKETLCELLAAQAGAEARDFMGTLPKLAHLGSADAIDGEPTAGDTVGPYRLISELGRGGMGAVWLAERADAQIKRRVALKLPRLAWGGALAERMARERDILATLAHPNIARLYDAGVDQQGRPYLAMEYVEGKPIDAYCREQALPLRARLQLLLQVCDAVAHAHARLVVHRDLKPANILVTADGQVRLLDFGIAKLMEGDRTAETSLTQLSGRALTLDYASPEQIRGEPLGTASDVYSLAVVAYELLAGARPYRLKRGSAAELEEAIASAEPAMASDAALDRVLKKQLKGDLDAILNNALKKDDGQRYATVEAFAQDLQRHLDRQPVLAQPDRFSYRAGKFVQRHQWRVLAGSVVALTLLGGAGVSLWQARLAQQQAQRAEQVKNFVLSIFVDADPDGGGGRQTTAVDLLKQARERLAAQPVSDPATAVELLTAVGTSLTGLGEYKQAQDILEKAGGLASEQLGPSHPSRAAAQLALGQALVLTGQMARAATALDEAEKSMRRLGDISGVVGALRFKSVVQLRSGRHDESVALAGQALQLAETHLAATNKLDLLAAYGTLWTAKTAAGQRDRLKPARRAYELAREIHADRLSNPVVSMRINYAFTLADEGGAVAGLAEMKEALKQQVQLLGTDHAEVYVTQLLVGHTLVATGDPLSAVASYREALRIETGLGGQGSGYNIAVARAAIGMAMANARRFDEAEQELKAADDLFLSIDPNHAYARLVRLARVSAWTRTHRLAEAEAALSPYLTGAPRSPREAAFTKAALGELRIAQGKHGDAQAALRESVKLFSEQPRPVNHATALAGLGLALLEDGRAAEALETLLRAAAALGALQPGVSPDHAELLVNITRARIALGQFDGAVAASTKAAAFWGSFAASSRNHGVALLWHARALSAAGNAHDAAEALRRAAVVLDTSAFPAERALLKRTQRDMTTTPGSIRG